MRKRLCKFNGVAVMRKPWGIDDGANRSAAPDWLDCSLRAKVRSEELGKGATRAQHACRWWKAPSEGDRNWSFMQRLRCEKVENGVGAGQQKVSRGPPWGRHIWDSATEGAVRWQPMLVVLPAVVVPRRVVESKVAGERRVAGWRGSRSGGCGRSLWAVCATGSGVGTHRALGSSTCVHCGERNRASEK